MAIVINPDGTVSTIEVNHDAYGNIRPKCHMILRRILRGILTDHGVGSTDHMFHTFAKSRRQGWSLDIERGLLMSLSEGVAEVQRETI